MKSRLLAAIVAALGLFSLAIQGMAPGAARPLTKQESEARERRHQPTRKRVSKETRVSRWQSVIKALEKCGTKDDELMRWAQGNLKRAQHSRDRGAGIRGWFEKERGRRHVREDKQRKERMERSRRTKKEREARVTERSRKAQRARSR